MTPADLVTHLELLPHPEGGYYRETYRSPLSIRPDGFAGRRPASTSIYYLLERGDFSALHRIRSDEVWHFHLGGELIIHQLDENGYRAHRLGTEWARGARPQVVIPAGAWFGSEPAEESAWSLVGCTVAPGFDFQDFELARAVDLLANFPEQKDLIWRLCRQ